MKVTFRHLTLALTALLLIPLASCAKDKPTPTPPDPQPAKHEDVIGKVRSITFTFRDKMAKPQSRITITYNKQLRFTGYIDEILENDKLIPFHEGKNTYDESTGHLIQEQSREVASDKWHTKRYTYTNGLLTRVEIDEPYDKRPEYRQTIIQYTYGSNQKKKAGVYTVVFMDTEPDNKTINYYSYSYEGEVEVENIYADKEMKTLISRNKRTYDSEGRITKEEPYHVKIVDNKEVVSLSSRNIMRYGIFGEKLFDETYRYDDLGLVSEHSITGIRYTKYNAQGLPIEGVPLEKKDIVVTLEYTFY